VASPLGLARLGVISVVAVAYIAGGAVAGRLADGTGSFRLLASRPSSTVRASSSACSGHAHAAVDRAPFVALAGAIMLDAAASAGLLAAPAAARRGRGLPDFSRGYRRRARTDRRRRRVTPSTASSARRTVTQFMWPMIGSPYSGVAALSTRLQPQRRAAAYANPVADTLVPVSGAPAMAGRAFGRMRAPSSSAAAPASATGAYCEPHSSATGSPLHGKTFLGTYRGACSSPSGGSTTAGRFGRRVVRVELGPDGRARQSVSFASASRTRGALVDRRRVSWCRLGERRRLVDPGRRSPMSSGV